MKSKIQNLTILALLLAVTAFLGGCASTEHANTVSLLTAAGFKAKTPSTDKQKEIYASLPDQQVMRATIKGKGVFYVYKDAAKGIAYVGRDAEYQQYHNLAVQQQIAQQYYMAAEMNQQAAYGWYGAWGPRAYWW
jgi:hypothetical protein